jgi:plasmid stabilization system protein ParE
MRLVFTEQAEESLKEALAYLAAEEVPLDKILAIRNNILSKAEMLLDNPKLGQKEEYLDHLGLGHRRLIESHYKIIYRLGSDRIYITDIFDSRQDPNKMKG